MSIDPNQQLKLGNPYRMVAMYLQSVSLIQALRELLHNGAHALITLMRQMGASNFDDLYPKGKAKDAHLAFDMYTFRHGYRASTPKMCVVDIGCGMNQKELSGFVGSLASSGYMKGERKGMGAKIAGLNISPWGLLYETWNGVDEPVRGILRLDHENEQCGWVKGDDGETFTHPPVRSLHPMVRKAGHGTVVVLLGEKDDDDTFVRFQDELGRSKAFSYFANVRYGQFPDGLRIAMTTSRSKKDRHDTDRRSVDILGMSAAVKHNADAHGVWAANGYDVIWAYTKELHATKRKTRRFSNGDNCLTHQVVTVALDDTEIPGLWENYEVYTQMKARSLLAEFGVGPIASNMAIQVRIHDRDLLGIFPNTERTLLLQDKKPLDLREIAREFRQNMPEELEEILTKDIESRSVDHTGDIEKILMRNPALYRTPRKPGTPPGTLDGEPGTDGLRRGGDGADPEGGDSPERGRDRIKEGTEGTPPVTPPTNTTTGKPPRGGGPGGWSGTKGLPDALRINLAVWHADNRPPEEEDTLARYDKQNRVLEVNHDCSIIDEEVDLEMKQRGLSSQRDRSIVKEAVIFHMSVCLVEGILRIERLKKQASSRRASQNWEFALEPQSLTAMASPRHHREWGISQSLKGKLGAKAR